MFSQRAILDKAMLALLLLAPIVTAAEEAVFPGRTWAHKAPAAVGLDAAKLTAMSEYIGGRGCVVRGGTM